MTTPQAINPWYREPWPWLLMAGPAAVMVAGVITTWIAFTTSDGLVAEDYYRQGLGINRSLARADAARHSGVVARLEFAGDRSRIAVTLEGPFAPRTLELRFAHATRAGLDRHLRLARTGERRYEAAFQPLAQGHWRLSVDDPGRSWSIAGDWDGRTDAATLAGR